jgi:hypothetical protein
MRLAFQLLLLSSVVAHRDPCLQPFGPRSIWNLPLGAGAQLVPASIHKRDGEFPYLSVDPDVIVLSGARCGGGAAPLTPVVRASGDWGRSKPSRCTAVGDSARNAFFSAPIPRNFTVPDAALCKWPRDGSCSWPWDDTQNYAAALLDADQDTVHQIQPFERCTVDGPATAADPYPTVSLHDDTLNSTFGAHGGSAFSSIGGTLRLGELLPDRAPYGPRHALKIELDASNYFYKPCFKFPAKRCDGYQMHQEIRVWAGLLLLACGAVAGCVGAARSDSCQERCGRKRRSPLGSGQLLTAEDNDSSSLNAATSPTATLADGDTVWAGGGDAGSSSPVRFRCWCCCCRPPCQRWLGYAAGALWLALALASAVAVLFPSLSASYRGVNPSLQMGSLLAVPPAATAEQLGLETQPAIMLHWTLQNYGAYVVDTTGWNVYALCTEVSPHGDVIREFEAAWNFSMIPKGGKGVESTGWGRDIQRLVDALHVVENWDAAMYAQVAQSGGKLGVGGGAARQPWAEPLGPVWKPKGSH